VPFIEPIPEDEATGAIAEIYGEERREDGYVANTVLAFSHRPALLDAWVGLISAVKAEMDPCRYELVTIAAARQLRSSYCMLAHGQVLASMFYDDESVRRIAMDHEAAGLDEVDVAVMDLAAKVADDAAAVEQADIDRLRGLGLTDAEIFDVVAAAAARAFFTKVVDGLGFQPDVVYAELDPKLRDALVVGRPIAES